MANPYCCDGKLLRAGSRVAFVRDDWQIGITRVAEHPAPHAPYLLENGLRRWGSELVSLEEPVWPN